uniref:Fibronectin type-III domain-containing protein n=1 Tax=viral metagenome TaxID=1070528 RepID=A0A6H1Z771_9ZZZZ
MKKILIFILLSFLLTFGATPAYAGIPALPHAFYGSVTINGTAAPDGSRVLATVDSGTIVSTQNPVTTVAGSYGIDSPKLLVQGDDLSGATITFYVNGVSTGQTAAFEAGGGPTTLDLSVPATPPSLSTSAASSITTSSATLNGILNSLGTALSVSVFFELGTTEAYGNTIVVLISQTGAFNATLSGLNPATTYHFRAKAVGDGTGYGLDQSFTTATPPPAPPAPPPAPPEPQLGTTDVRGMVGAGCRFTESVPATSDDGLCTLTIPEGTVGLTEDLECLPEITMVTMDDPPPPPADAHVIGLVYDFGPDGATFDPAITLTFTYDPDSLPEGVSEEDLVIAYFIDGEWIELECVVDTETNTITALVSHFTTFALIGTPPTVVEEEPPVVKKEPVVVKKEEVPPVVLVVEEEPVVEEEEEPAVVEEEVEPAPVEEEVEEILPPAGINWPVVGGIIAGLVVVGWLGFLFWRRRAYN